MAKSKNTTKKRVSKKAQGPANHLKIWVGVLVVLIVAVVGVVIVRFSEASPGRAARDVWIGLVKVANSGQYVGWREYVDSSGNVQYLQLSVSDNQYNASRGSGKQYCYVAFTDSGVRVFNFKYRDGVGPGQYAAYRSPYCPSGGRTIGSGVR